MTLGLEVIKFMLEQDEDNVPIVQDWIDKWFWRGYRLLPGRDDDGLHAAEEGDVLEGSLRALLRGADARRRCSRTWSSTASARPSTSSRPIAERSTSRHQALGTFYQFSHAADFNTIVPDARRDGLAVGEVPGDLRQATTARASNSWREQREAGQALLQPRAADAVPDLPDPDGLHRAGRPDHDLLPRERATTASVITSAPTAASGSSSASRRSTSRPGCRCTRSTRATASPKAPTRRCRASIH